MNISPILQDILDVVIDRAEQCGLPGWCRTTLHTSAAAWDVCCECSDGSGQLWVRLAGMEPDPDYPQPLPSSCDQPIRLTVAVGSLRCIPTLDANGNYPTAEEETAASTLIMWDAEVIKDAVMCSLDERFWQSWAPLDYQGGCGGGEHIFSIPFSACRCDDCDESVGSPGQSS